MSVVIAGFDTAAAVPDIGATVSARVLHAVLPGRFDTVVLADVGDAAQAEDVLRRVAGASAGRYEPVHVGSTAAPAFDPDADPADGVWFVNCFTCPAGGEDAAFEMWARVNEYMVVKPGYRGHRLHRRIGDGAPFGLVNVAEWESVAAWQAAHDAGFRARAGRADMPFQAFPTLCRAEPVAVR